ncbi:MAG: hypothetical protein A3F09_01080 [Chlamydiae bacterium RIFCSPHIGHO2_12_FULL_49_11]|nr:MAG: hypothetical protein A3F09_01080 [Chlamydiae bacterium RIFCSPHIGHO2_12_FULL_49_11]
MRLFITLFFAFSAFAAPKELVVGTASGYAPFVSLTPEGEYEGFDIDVARLLAEKMKKKLVIKDLGSMPSLIIALRQGKIDLIIWAVSITAKRCKEMHLVHYTGEAETTVPLLFWKEVPKGIVTLDDVVRSGKHVCIEVGTGQEEILKQLANLNIKNIDKIMDGVMEVRFGKSMAVAVDSALVEPLTRKIPELKVCRVEVPSELQMQGMGIGIRKTDEDLVEEVEKWVAELKQSGELTRLEKKWKLK